MKRRTFIQAGFASITSTSVTGFAQGSEGTPGGRELVVHTVHEALVHSTPLTIYSGLKSTPVDDPILHKAAGAAPTIEVWDGWNDYDMRQAFGGLQVSGPVDMLGAYLIYDTPDIAHAVHQPMVEEIERGHLNVGGVRASWMDAGAVGFGSKRLWNVVITGVGGTENETEEVMLGLVKHLGRALGVLDPI